MSARQTGTSLAEDVRASVCAELSDNSGTDPHVLVAVSGGVVTLSGDVTSRSERVAAKQAAMLVPGVTAVVDELQVRSPETPAPNDADIARAAARLLGSAGIPSGTVHVEVRDRVVTLFGKVTWNRQRVAAVRAVMHINGVTGVTNRIALSTTP
jgi:osmotically-inducible protein OsmY